MRKTAVTVSFDEEKLTALRLYLGQKDLQVETEMERAMDALYQKTVPAGVREFIDLRAGISVPAGKSQRKVKHPEEQEAGSDGKY